MLCHTVIFWMASWLELCNALLTQTVGFIPSVICEWCCRKRLAFLCGESTESSLNGASYGPRCIDGEKYFSINQIPSTPFLPWRAKFLIFVHFLVHTSFGRAVELGICLSLLCLYFKAIDCCKTLVFVTKVDNFNPLPKKSSVNCQVPLLWLLLSYFAYQIINIPVCQ